MIKWNPINLNSNQLTQSKELFNSCTDPVDLTAVHSGHGKHILFVEQIAVSKSQIRINESHKLIILQNTYNILQATPQRILKLFQKFWESSAWHNFLDGQLKYWKKQPEATSEH